MKFTKEIKRAIQQAIDYTTKQKIEGTDIDIYYLINRYKALRESSEDMQEQIYDALSKSLGLNDTSTLAPIIRAAKIYGYARVSIKSQEDNTSLEAQVQKLTNEGAIDVFQDVFTGATMDRPNFMQLERNFKKGDTLVVTKLDRFSRSAELGITKVKELAEKGIKVNILNMGLVDLSTAMGKMVFTVLSAFAEFEKDTIVERMREGKEQAKARSKEQGVAFKEGRPKKFNQTKIDSALELLESKSIREVAHLKGISESTLKRAKRKKSDIYKLNNN